MDEGEVTHIIIDLGQAKTFKAFQNHVDYLIWRGKLNRLKRNGRIMTAQATTTERCQITVGQQLKWHYLIKSEWEHLQSFNLTSDKFTKLQENSQLNMDEACFLCNDGI